MYLKWVGGKSAIATDLIQLFPKTAISHYIEPFLGSGSMYFAYLETFGIDSLFPPNNSQLPSFSLSDLNPFLVNCHKEVKNNTDGLCTELKQLETTHNGLSQDERKKFYLQVRKIVTDSSSLAKEPAVMAARFIYINKTCFNGLWRVNSKGGFNVPYNDATKLSFNYGLIKKAASSFSHSIISLGEFDSADDSSLNEKTFVYMDPPYVPLNLTSSFASYTKDGFGPKELQRIVAFCEKLDSFGTKWMVSNSSAKEVYEAFKKWNISEIKVHRFVRAIKNKNETREKVAETVITNY